MGQQQAVDATLSGRLCAPLFVQRTWCSSFANNKRHVPNSRYRSRSLLLTLLRLVVFAETSTYAPYSVSDRPYREHVVALLTIPLSLLGSDKHILRFLGHANHLIADVRAWSRLNPHSEPDPRGIDARTTEFLVQFSSLRSLMLVY